jgi:hypothetical protein
LTGSTAAKSTARKPTLVSSGRSRRASACATKTLPTPAIHGSTRSADAPSDAASAASA